MQTIGGREPLHGELGRFYDAIENPRRTRGELPILRDAELRSYMADVRERTLDVLDGGRARRRRRGPAASRRLRLRDAARARAPAQRDDAAAAADGRRLRAGAGRPRPRRRARRRRPGDGRGRRRRGTRSAPRPPASPTTTSARRHTVELAAFEIDRAPVDNGAYAAFVEETGAEPPMYWERDGGAAGCETAMGGGEVDPAQPGRPRLLARGRGIRPLGRQAAADRARVGGRRQRRDASERRRRAPGSGRRRSSSPIPGFEAFPYREYSRSSSVPATRCCAAAPGRASANVGPPQLPQLGPPRAAPDLRRDPLREGRVSVNAPPPTRSRSTSTSPGGRCRGWRPTSAPA